MKTAMGTPRVVFRHVLFGALLLAASTAVAGPTPAQTCEQAKNKEAGKYGYCRQKAEAKFAITGDGAQRTVGLEKCATKYALTWALLESKAVAAGSACPSVGDQVELQQAIEAHTSDIATALAGGGLGDCSDNLATCQADLGTCQGQFDTCQGDLGSCQSDRGICETALDMTGADLLACDADLAACEAVPRGQCLKTGQTTCWGAGDVIACADTGQDGELQKGLARTYVDNGDGTITDTRTGLIWEKQSDDGTLNDKDNLYTWAGAFAVKIAGLNAGGGFAGYTDWRLPNVNELLSLVDYGAVNPSVSAAFNTACTGGCTLATCSCTLSSVSWSDFYWSSSTYAAIPSYAWLLNFYDGSGGGADKQFTFAVRGVRGGS